MANILSEQSKKAIIKEYRLRLLIVFLTSLTAVFAVGSTLLVPNFIMVASSERSLSVRREQYGKQLSSREQEEWSRIADRTTEYMQVFEKGGRAYTMSGVILSLLEIRPDTLSVESVNYELKEGIPVIIMLGTAQTRNDLIAFRDGLKLLNVVDSVELPIGNLAKDQNIEFTLTVNLKHTE